uniref:DNA damage-inducible transcript 4 protein n=1 Tax=Denticeps clupeoides TaxID=299321 RepID=A0AAY4CKY5_9TELE
KQDMSFLHETRSMDGSFPPSPLESDSAPKRLSWGKVLQKLAELNHSQTEGRSVSGSLLSEDNLFSDPWEERLCADVVDIIARSLADAKVTLGCSKLTVPQHLLHHVGQELLHLSATEPCGLRGAVVDLCVEHDETFRNLEQIAVDPCLVPTFHLTLVLRVECRGLWPKFTRRLNNSLRLHSGFKVIKKKLYSPRELFIEEF